MDLLNKICARSATVAIVFIGVAANIPAQTPRIRDSVGIRIVENPSRLKAPIVFTLGTKPNVDIGGLDDDPDKELNSKNPYPRAIRLEDGRIAVIDRTRIQFFDRTGKRVRITGRSGGGPGEFGTVTALCRTHGDTVFASDEQNRRVSILSETGEFHSVATLPVGHFSEREFCLTDGTFIANQIIPTGRGSDGLIRINHINRAGSVMNMIAEVNTGVFDMAIRRESPVSAWGQSVAFGDAIDYEIRVFSASGKLATVIRTADKPEPISRAELEKLTPLGVRANSTEAERRDDARRIAAASHTKTWPAYDRLLPDLSGRLWMQDWRQNQAALEPEGWTAFDASGKMIGRLIIPAPTSKEQRQFVVHFGRDEVFIRRLDENGALHYIAYPIVSKK
ncbi:MAG: hypothetical protein ABI852_15370 [Gemmatimonadaceae bacterium]